MSVNSASALKPWASIEALDSAAKFLHQAANDAGREVPNQLKKAGRHGGEAVGNVGGAVANAVKAVGSTRHVLLGTLAELSAGSAAVIGGGTAALGAGAWTAEEGLKGTAWLAHNLAKALVKLCNFLNKVAGSGDRYEINKILGDPTAEKISTQLFKMSDEMVEITKEFAKFGWDEYAQAFKTFGEGALGTVGNVALAAGHLGMMGVHLGGAAIFAGDAAAIKMAEVCVLASKVAVQYAQDGVKASADAVLIAAKASAAVGNFLQHQSDPHYKITPKQISALEDELKALATA